ncbi:hypothetical protein SAMN02745857_03503 [Andreprevotia lacus DSM 23236]|jgi:hypothetical protein|uniref:Uncharacterized protein n=1 Tax=Andreprevotia lacus DSM 23236 TaxID=1121001 RepID=A0A1W1XYF5_9NEIS|nr:hypothetical protein [Andreprevotia lacus]SMC28953.1 hypothetical protein SAMN02745857_03503 [Andreprevotia lacus DSM 23236]
MVVFYRCSILALLIWAAVGAYCWATFALPPEGKVIGATRHQAQLDIPRPPNLRADLTTLGQSDLWGRTLSAAPVAAAASAPLETWTRIAVVREGKSAYVLLSGPKGELKPFSAGDTLPDGGKLTKVSPEEIVVRPVSGKPQTYRLLN